MLNKAILMGRLTRDPEIKYTANNIAVCTFTLAIDRRYAKPGEEKQTDFINIVTWRQTAEFVSKYFVKGQQVAVEGRIQTRTWDDPEGQRRYFTEVVANEVFFADSKRDGGYGDVSEGPGYQDANLGGQSGAEGFTPIDVDDDLPF